VSFARLWQAIERDKKFRGTIRVVFLSRIGKAEVAADLDPDSLRSWLREFVVRKRIAVRRTHGRHAGARRGDGV
jgi:3-dehydroquinate synthetase